VTTRDISPDRVAKFTAARPARVERAWRLPRVPGWKRAIDLGVAVPALILLSPIMLIVVVLIYVTGSGPALFRQVRVGRGEATFTMLKFRTMRGQPEDEAGSQEAIRRELSGEALPDADTKLYRPHSDTRVTPIGGFLRRYSIDELPQLINVIRGDMSLVGPRPALPSEVELFTHEQRRRHACLPGLTGLWQVSGRNRLTSRDMLQLDLTYVERISFWLDLGILLRTPRAVLFQRYTR
jgi:lipopolysaccharide/colanic/teichoic acid biosynthesis glycosyltransferase